VYCYQQYWCLTNSNNRIKCLTGCSEQQPNRQPGHDVSAAGPSLELPTMYESIDASTASSPDDVYLRPSERPEHEYENADATV